MRQLRTLECQAEWSVLREMLVTVCRTDLADFIVSQIAVSERLYTTVGNEIPSAGSLAMAMHAEDRKIILGAWERLLDEDINDVMASYHEERLGIFRQFCDRVLRLTSGSCDLEGRLNECASNIATTQHEAIDTLRAYRKVIERCDAIMRQLTQEGKS